MNDEMSAPSEALSPLSGVSAVAPAVPAVAAIAAVPEAATTTSRQTPASRLFIT